MTCKQLGGGCDLKFSGETFEEIVEQSKQHGMEMFQKGDADHLKAIQEIQQMMMDPEAMQKWFQQKKEEFEALPEE